MISKAETRVRAALLRLSRERKVDHQLLLVRYANERFLARLSRSRHRDEFVLKGATLFHVWFESPFRATRDLDLLAYGDPSAERILSVFSEVLSMKIDGDGILFEPARISMAPIREDQPYGGLRVEFPALLGTARIAMQIDLGFGDAVVHEPIELRPLLDEDGIALRVYPKEAVIAEKAEAMHRLDVWNSRMKDFFDVATLAERCDFEGERLRAAIDATFRRRGTPVSPDALGDLGARLRGAADKREQWAGFLRKSRATAAGSWDEVLDRVLAFLLPPFEAVSENLPFRRRWSIDGGWR